MGRYFFEIFFMYARPIPVQTKVYFKILQFLAVTYDMEVLICAFDVIYMEVFFFSFVQAIFRN